MTRRLGRPYSQYGCYGIKKISAPAWKKIPVLQSTNL
jgi:hypothetical protein